LKLSRRRFVTRVLPGAALALALPPAKASPAASFVHGVASGDPTATGILIWTRLTPRYAAETEVGWEVAGDPEFSVILRRGAVAASPRRDFTVKAVVEGLDPGRDYYYRFHALGAVSQTGRTRTLPVGTVEGLVVAACSCSNYPAGYFNAYRAMARNDDIDLVVHLGDYLYEYEATGYASGRARELHRESVPGHEVVSLADYRLRHAQYKSDPDLQAVHARHPFIVSWDDHEFANDAWRDGAQNHDASEGDWALRRRAALQAYYEWMPIREPAGGDTGNVFRAFELGDLGTLLMLETRISARTAQLDLPASVEAGTLDTDLADPERRLLSDGQRSFVADRLAASRAAGKPWQVFGNQVLMAQITAPNLAENMSAAEIAALPDYIRPYVEFTRRGVPLSTDGWDGYAAERAWLLERCRETEASPVVLSGDSHAAWALDVLDHVGGAPAAVEFGTTSISSPGYPETLGIAPERIQHLLREANPNLHYTDVAHRGYLALELTRERAEVRFHVVDTVYGRDFRAWVSHRMGLAPRSGRAPMRL
jgi:alkaline phosphatase D